MDEQQEFAKALARIEQDLQRLETEYGKFFNHRRTRPPLELRSRVEAGFRRWANFRAHSSTDRFRLSTLQARYATYVRLWDGAIRAREEGRPGPFSAPAAPGPPQQSPADTTGERRGTTRDAAPGSGEEGGDEEIAD